MIDIDDDVKWSFVVGEELVEFFRSVKGFLAALASLVHLIDDETGQESVDGDGVDGNEESADSESDDEHDLNHKTCTTRR